MKLIADPIYLPDNANWQTIEDAKANAKWHKVISKEELQARTDLTGKCGSCKFFKPYDGKYKCRGDCMNGRVGFRQRCSPACKGYEKKRR